MSMSSSFVTLDWGVPNIVEASINYEDGHGLNNLGYKLINMLWLHNSKAFKKKNNCLVVLHNCFWVGAGGQIF